MLFRLPDYEYLLRRYAAYLTRDSSEVEDLVQETYARAIPALERLEHRDDVIVKAWLYTILKNIWRNELRRRRTMPPTIPLDPEIVEELTDRSICNHEIFMSVLTRQQVRSAIALLPRHSRDVIELRELEGLSYREIALVLECPIGTVMSRLKRARAKLALLLSGRM